MLKLWGLPDEHIIALAWACKGTWRVGLELRQPFQSAELRWEVGQPLGLKPSMSMFSLAHNMLLTGICREKGLEPEEVFRVLGDDVVIVDDGVHQAYLACMKEAGVPVSWNKSHSSSRYAEFAGASITNTSIVRPGQWRQVREGNAVALAETLGTPLFGEVTEMLLKVQKLDLFRKGMFSPPTDEWPCYIRLATLMSHRQLMASVIKGTPFWYYRIMKEYQRQLAPFFGFTSLNGWVQGNPSLIGFTWDEPNVRKTLFQPLRHYLLDDVVSEYHRSCLTINAQYEIVAVRAYSAVASLYERMLISQTEAGNLLNEISEQLRSLLYLPPTGRNVSLNRLVREYRDLLSRAQGCDDETHSML
jgi:hypothetical protein